LESDRELGLPPSPRFKKILDLLDAEPLWRGSLSRTEALDFIRTALATSHKKILPPFHQVQDFS